MLERALRVCVHRPPSKLTHRRVRRFVVGGCRIDIFRCRSPSMRYRPSARSLILSCAVRLVAFERLSRQPFGPHRNTGWHTRVRANFAVDDDDGDHDHAARYPFGRKSKADKSSKSKTNRLVVWPPPTPRGYHN